MDDICPNRLSYIHRLCEETGAVVVLSSSWRHFFPVKEMNEKLGLVLAGVTDSTLEDNRGIEIHDWVLQHGVKQFVILDDRDDMAPHMDRLIQTDDAYGITARHFRLARKMLA